MTIFADRVKDTSTTTGTGSLTLAGSAPTGFQTFAASFSVGDPVAYAIQLQGGTEWETGIGTLVTSTTISRDTVSESSNADALVNFSAGTKDVFCTPNKSQIRSIFSGGQAFQTSHGNFLN